jgi:hypothetical protein
MMSRGQMPDGAISHRSFGIFNTYVIAVLNNGNVRTYEKLNGSFYYYTTIEVEMAPKKSRREFCFFSFAPHNGAVPDIVKLD